MGLSYLAFACSIDAFASVYSSRDEALWAALVNSEDRAVRHYLKLHLPAASHPLDVPEHLRALHDVFRGAGYFRCRPHEYAYAHLACAYVLGASLGESTGSYGRAGRLQAALDARGEDGDPLGLYACSDWPLPGLPMLQDWPQYWAFPAGEVALRAAHLKGLVARVGEAELTGDEEPMWSLLTDLAGFYSDCAARGQDLIMVAH